MPHSRGITDQKDREQYKRVSAEVIGRKKECTHEIKS